jgi:hypothetical protein
MSSPSLPSLSSLQPVARARGFVTARSVFGPLEQGDNDKQEGEASKAPATSSNEHIAGPSKMELRATAVPKEPLVDTLDSAPPRPRTRKRAAVISSIQDHTADAPPGPKRGRPRKAVSTAATNSTSTDTHATQLSLPKPAAKRGRKKAVASEHVDSKVIKTPPEPPRKKSAPSQSGQSANVAAGASNTDILSNHTQSNDNVLSEILDLDPAPRRRQGWTPPVESCLPVSFQSHDSDPVEPFDTSLIETVDHDQSNIQSPAAVDFKKLMGDFGYQEDNTRPPPPLSRNSSDGPTTKRKRLDTIDVAAVEVLPKRTKKDVVPKEPKPKKNKDAEPKAKKKKKDMVPKVPKEPKPKKPRAPKKKPVTITALATAAYRHQPVETEEDADQSKSISDFFRLPQPDPAIPSAPDRTTEDKPAPKRKRAKKVQINVPEIHVKLDSPETAREKLKRQQWLFGSSSQLGAVESPTELRDLQQALKESENMISSQHVDYSCATSYAHVPSAPHGTCLSIGQANRVLWMSAARDFEDSTFCLEEGSDASDGVKLALESCAPQEAKLPLQVFMISSSDPKAAESPNSGFVDIDQLGEASPRKTGVKEESMSDPAVSVIKDISVAAPISHEIVDLEVQPKGANTSRRAFGRCDPNTHLAKQVVDVDIKVSARTPRKTAIRPPIICLDSPERQPCVWSRTLASDAAPIISPTVGKLVIAHKPGSPSGHGARTRHVANNALPNSSQKPRERVHETLHSLELAKPSNPRGRPPKVAPTPRLVSPARPRGRPRKSASPDTLPTLARLRNTPLDHGSSPQRAVVIDPSSDYLDIDAISDPEMDSHVATPPRCLPDSSPKATLEFDRPPPPTPLTLVPAARCTAKQLQAEWSNIATTLFPRITQIVRSTPPSRDHRDPTWHEKMLLYDPIVLEDLTAWLNSEGLRIDVILQKTKGKKKVGEAEEAVQVSHEELQPWMVQKWCEEHSVCCLWKEGLRGGVRQRY